MAKLVLDMIQATVDQAIQRALLHHQAGRLAEAEVLYRQALTEAPGHPDALHLLGALACQVALQNFLGVSPGVRQFRKWCD